MFYAAGVLGMDLPPVFENPNDPGGVSFLSLTIPALVLGRRAEPGSAATARGVHRRAAALLLRPGIYVRHLLASGTALKAWLFAAIKLTSPQFPVAPELEGAVAEALSALEAGLQGPPAIS